MCVTQMTSEFIVHRFLLISCLPCIKEASGKIPFFQCRIFLGQPVYEKDTVPKVMTGKIFQSSKILEISQYM